jgi:hypothetical protein
MYREMRVEDTSTRVVSHDTGFCPVPEARKALGLSTREVCPSVEPALVAKGQVQISGKGGPIPLYQIVKTV